MRLLCETNLDESHHDFGEITYCTKCCWKRINLKSNETVHEDSICWCESHVKKHKSLIVRLCIKHKVLSTFCKFCTSIINQNCDTIYHIYKFADDDETDYDQFYMCPIVEGEKKIPPVSFNKTCTNCGETNPTCTTVATSWFCYQCKKEQLNLFTKPRSYCHMENMKPFNVMSAIVWDCHLCYNVNVSLFNDEIKQQTTFKCSYCNH